MGKGGEETGKGVRSIRIVKEMLSFKIHRDWVSWGWIVSA